MLKLNAAGNHVWARDAIGPGIDKPFGIAVDASGNSYVTGEFSEQVSGLGTNGQGLSLFDGANGFVFGLDSAGEQTFVFSFGNDLPDRGRAVALDGSGNAYVTGEFSRVAEFDPVSGFSRLFSNGGTDMFVARFTN